MEQMAAKLASLVPPPQPRDELVVEKIGAEKGRETGEARRRPLERSTVEVKGAGGILVIGGLLAAAAGATIIARRAQAKRPPAIKKERVDGINGDHKSEQSQIDGSVGIPEDNRVSVKSKDNLFEDDTCNGAKELPNGRVLDVDQVNEKVPESSPEAAAEEEMKEKKEAESSPQQEEGEEEIEDKKENKSSPEPEGEEIEEKKEAEASPEGKEHEEEKEEKKDIDTPREGEEKDEHEELESSLEGEGDETHSNQTQPHMIHSEVGAEEFSTTKETDEVIEKRQPAPFAQEEDGSKNNQIQTNIADPQHRAEEQSIVNEVEKKGEERQESDSSPEEAAQLRGDGSGSARVSSAKLNEAAITPSEVVEQAEIPLHEVESKILSDSLITSGEVKDEVHVNEAEEKQEESIICRDKIPDNLAHANKVEEKEEQGIIGREKNTDNVVQQHLMAIIREKALVLEKFLMDIPDRLLVGFLVMALTIVLLHYTKLSHYSIT
ncbi:uncharacterized protein LOC141833586 [Curcuma longa]|uniref:uncharacterized protein LOC141833586 n=1 Tax=Curcuma longa TaxID=136217 RepID=UPI003D9F90A6